MTRPSPKQIKTTDETVHILWNDGHPGEYTTRELRLACRCAACIDEWSGENKINIQQIPAVIKAAGIEVVGNYALSFQWSDGHSTGIFTYDYLREICSCPQCRSPRTFDV